MSETKGTYTAATREQTAHDVLHDALYQALRIVETYDFSDNEMTRALGKIASGLVILLRQAVRAREEETQP